MLRLRYKYDLASLKSNIIYNGLGTLTGILFPIVTFPYAARVVLPDGIGAVNFLGSIINYIVLLTSLGIPIYAVKEIARYRDDPRACARVAVEIMILSAIMCTLGYVAVWLLSVLVDQIHRQASLFYVMSLSILFTAMGVEWFYRGIEDFRFITIRGIIVKTACATCLFIFVKSPEDIIAYGAITVGATVGNGLLNFIHLRKYFSPDILKGASLKIRRHLRPVLHVFSLSLITSLYLYLNMVILGFIAGEKAVGFYTAGTRFSFVGLTLISSIGTAVLPRCSYLSESGQKAEFANVILKSLDLTIAVSLPLVAAFMLLASPLTALFCGPGYEESVGVVRITAPIVLLVSLTQVIGIQALYVLGKVNTVIISVAAGALVSIVSLIALVPSMGSHGAAIATLLAESAVLLVQLILGIRHLGFNLLRIRFFPYLWAAIAASIAGCVVLLAPLPTWAQLCIAIAVGSGVYMAILTGIHDPVITEIGHFILRKKSSLSSLSNE